jgi:hypothetical protein
VYWSLPRFDGLAGRQRHIRDYWSFDLMTLPPSDTRAESPAPLGRSKPEST